MKGTRKTLILSVISIMLMSVPAASSANDCRRIFGNIKSWVSQKHDDSGKCHMENVPDDNEYPADSIPYKLRDGKELCPKHRYEMDWEYVWEKGKRISGIYHLGSNSHMSLKYIDSFTPVGPVLIYRKDKLFCEVPINEEGEPDGVVKEYSIDGKLMHGFRMVNDKWKGGFVEYDKKGRLKSFACEDAPLFDGDSDRCGFNGTPAIVELANGTILTHFEGKLTAKETIGADGSRTVKKLTYPRTDVIVEQITELDKSGRVHRKFFVKNEKRDGDYQEYDENGKLAVEKEYKDGVDLVEKKYYMNGKLQEHSVRNTDDTSISTKSYWDNGQLQSVGVYIAKRRSYYGNNWTDTVPVGKLHRYAEDGTLSEEANYDHEGNLEGNRILMNEKGKRIEAAYKKGTLVAKKIFTADGKLELEEQYYEDG